MTRRKLFALTLLFVILSASSSFGAFREVQFGRYYQASRELTPVQWLVLDEDDDSLLLLTKDCVDCLPYNERRIVVTLENSTLRKWLNNEFLNTAFNSQEQAAIISLSLLTLDEAMKYLPEVSQRQCSPTVYAKTRGAYTNGRGLCAWWLSSPGNDPLQAAYFSSAGDLGNRPHYVDYDVIGDRDEFTAVNSAGSSVQR